VIAFTSFVCMDPLWLGGIGGKKGTPIVGWQVLVRSHRLESGNWMECAQDNLFGAFTSGYGTHVYICIEW
jgi:hypothetical protein